MRAEHVLLQDDYTSAVHCRDKALSENADLQSKCQSQRSIIDTLNDQLERLVRYHDSGQYDCSSSFELFSHSKFTGWM